MITFEKIEVIFLFYQVLRRVLVFELFAKYFITILPGC